MTIDTDRLLLRPYSNNDSPAVHAYASEPVVAQYMLWGPNSDEETHVFLRTVQEGAQEEPRTKFDFAIELKDERKMIGGCGIYLKGSELLSGELGYVLNLVYHRRGIMPEAVHALIGFGFDSLGLHRIFARTIQTTGRPPGSWRSAECNMRAGSANLRGLRAYGGTISTTAFWSKNGAMVPPRY